MYFIFCSSASFSFVFFVITTFTRVFFLWFFTVSGRTTRTKTARRHYYRRTFMLGRRSTARTFAFFRRATDNRSDDDRAESRTEQKIAIFHKYNLGGEKLFASFAATIYYAVNRQNVFNNRQRLRATLKPLFTRTYTRYRR